MESEKIRLPVNLMNRFSKPVVVLAGYAASLLLALAIFYIYSLMRAHIADASGGMQAFGDFLLFVGLFGFLSLFPTALALYFLRPFEKFWDVFSVASLAFAAAGPIAASMLGMRHQNPSAALFGFSGLLIVLGSPLLCFGFSVCAVIAPTHRSRWALISAAVIEFAVFGYGLYCLLVVGHWLS